MQDIETSAGRRLPVEERIEALVAPEGGCSRRLKIELARIMMSDRNDSGGTLCRPEGNDIHRWKALVHGPRGTPFEGGTFLLDLRIPDRYPWESTSVRFATKVWHPDVCPDTGTICRGALFLEGSPAMTIQKSIISVQALLSGRVEADENISSRRGREEEWYEKARLWSQKYAGPQCSCELCQKLAEAFAIGLHPRLGQHSPLMKKLSGIKDLANMIHSFVTPRETLTDSCVGGFDV